MKKKVWVFGKPTLTTKLQEWKKHSIEQQCQPLVNEFKKKFISDKPDKTYSYLIDFYTYWKRNYLYFCGKYKSEIPDSIADEFECKLVRLEYTGNDKFNFFYLRHTGQWSPVAFDLSRKDCLDMIHGNPLFQPIG